MVRQNRIVNLQLVTCTLTVLTLILCVLISVIRCPYLGQYSKFAGVCFLSNFLAELFHFQMSQIYFHKDIYGGDFFVTEIKRFLDSTLKCPVTTLKTNVRSKFKLFVSS